MSLIGLKFFTERVYAMYDVIIIGAGVTGCAVARELSKYTAKVLVIEREEDVCAGTSKANSAIIHAGFDAKPGTLKARFNVRGNEMMDELAEKLDIPFKRNGSLVVRTKDQDHAILEELLARGRKNGVPDLRIVDGEELRALEPNLSEDVVEALYAPTGSIVCPFHMTMAFAENAYENGVEFSLSNKVHFVERLMDHFSVAAEHGHYESRIIVNAAGVYADQFHNDLCETKIRITARKGEYMLLDKTAGTHVTHTVFQLPGKMGKGVLVTPTVHGNLLVGPTATDVEDREAVNTTLAGLDELSAKSALSVKDLPLRSVITSFAGLRAHEDGDDFIVGEVPGSFGVFDAVGIESPGLSSAPAIGEFLAKEIADVLNLQKKNSFKDTRKGILNPQTLSLEERNALIKENPAYGNIICRCEMISEGEILDAIHRPLGAKSLDGVKRRTRAGMGRCQSGFCSPRTMEILQREVGLNIMDVTKSGGESGIVIGKNKQLEEVLV